MSFFGGKKEQDQPKKRSTLGFLFNPEVGKDLKPISEALSLFPRLIAMVFSAYRLFPKDHPAFGDMRIRLTLRDVIGMAYSQLRFTRDGLPQVIMFAAVVGMLAIGALTLLTLAMSLFVGNANAQMFESQASNDIAYNWIDFLFYGKDLAQNTGTVAGTVPCTIQPALSSALAFYSNAILVLAGIVLMYHLGSMIAETAHSGQPFGKRANQIWAPIRLVVAVGLLVPVGAAGGGGAGSCSVSGYNAGQYIAITMARMGSGLASNVWSLFLSNLASTSASTCVSGGEAPSCVRDVSDVTLLVSSLMSYDACARIVNYHVTQMGLDDFAIVPNLLGLGKAVPGKRYYMGYSLGQPDNIDDADAERLCGGYEVPRSAGENSIYSDIGAAQLQAFETLKQKIAAFNIAYLSMALDGPQAPGYVQKQQQAATEYRKVIEEFKNDLNQKMAAGIQISTAKEKQQSTATLSSPEFTESGWLVAGAWFNAISRMQADRSAAINNALPIPLSPSRIFYSGSERTSEGNDGKKIELEGVWASSKKTFDQYKAFVQRFNDHYSAQYANDLYDKNESLAMSGSKMPDSDGLLRILKSTNPVEWMLGLVDKAAIGFGLWDSDGTLAIKFGKTANPLAEITAFGQNAVSMGGWSLGFAALAALAGSEIAGFSIGPVASMFASLLTFLASLFYLVGFSMAFIVPLYPFYRFFFGAVQWLIIVVEAVVSAPLFALAHLSPYGDGLPGQKASYGYSVGVQLLLRPVLMIFGLAVGFLLFSAALSFLNFAFEIAARGTGAFNGNALVAKLVYTLVYAAFVLILADQSFKTIGVFPQVALNYLGMQGIKEEKMNPQMLAAAAAYVGKDLAGGAIKNAAMAPAGALNSIAKKRNTDAAEREKLAGQRIAGERHNQLIAALGGGGGAGGGGAGGGGAGGGGAGGGGRGPEDVARANQFLSDAGYTGPKYNSPGQYTQNPPPPPGRGSAQSGAGLVPPSGPGNAPSIGVGAEPGSSGGSNTGGAGGAGGGGGNSV